MPILSSLVLAAMAVILAAVVQVLTGFGFALVSIPLLMYIYPGYDSVLISMVLSLVIYILLLSKIGMFIRWDLVWRLTLIGLAGIIAGIALSDKLNAVHLKSIIGLAVIVYVIIQWVSMEKERRRSRMREAHGSNDSEEAATESDLDKNEKLPKGFTFAGLLSGFLLGVVGMPGPPIVAVLVQFLKKETFLATIIVYFFINNSLVFIIAISTFYTERLSIVFSVSIILVIPLIIGFFIGNPLRKFVNEQNFKRIVFGLLILIGCSSIWEAMMLLWTT